MRTRLFIALLLVGMAAPARAAPGGLLLLSSPPFADDERGLVEALRIYTRDLRISLELGGALSGAGPIAQAADLGARDGAELVIWFDGDARTPSLFAYRVSTGELRATPATPRNDRDLCAQTLALKLRALLVDRGDLRDWAPAVLPAATSDAVSPPAPSPLPLPARPLATRAVELEAGTAYRVDGPSDPARLRHGALLRVGLSLVRLPLDVTLDGGYAFRATTSAGRDGISDLPLGVTVGLRLRRDRYQLGAGPRIALHLFSVDGASVDGRTAAQQVVSAGVGLSGEARLRLSDRVALFVAGSVEALVPGHRFFVDGGVALYTGPVLAQGAAGVVVRLW